MEKHTSLVIEAVKGQKDKKISKEKTKTLTITRKHVNTNNSKRTAKTFTNKMTKEKKYQENKRAT